MKPWLKKLFIALSLISLLFCAAIAALWTPDKPLTELKTKWATPPSSFLEVDNMQVHLRDEGPKSDPTPIVLLHGNSSSLHAWGDWAVALRDQKRVIRMDLPAFGLTGPNLTDDYRITAYTEFVINVMNVMKVEKFILAGNSLGGEIAWNIANQQPKRVEKLILIDASGYKSSSTSEPVAFKIARTPVLGKLLEYVLPRSIVEKSVSNVFGNPDKVTDEIIDRVSDLTLRPGNRRALPLRLAQRFTSNPENIKSISTPTLIMWGGQDRLIPVEAAQWFKRDIKDSKIIIFEHLGHVPHEEGPAETVSEAKRFIGIP
jgi:pimeloyl-ACP methyl ester carboxylesterase